MQKAIIFVIFPVMVMLIAACSGYLNNPDYQSIKGDEFLALADGSGYLSSDNYNEITPFLYRDSGKAWLFFASDRPGGRGGYDIYYAEMDSSGKFSRPVAISNSINTSADEICPIVFKYYSAVAGLTNIYLTYQGKGKVNETIIMTYQMDSSFNLTSGLISSVTDMNAVYLEVQSYSGSITPYIYISEGTTNIPEYSFSGSWTFFFTNVITFPVYSMNQFYSNFGSMQYITYNVFTTTGRQLSGMKVLSISNNNTTNLLDLSAYKTSEDEITPFIDAGDGYKVYFASKRAGRGNFDLYRYNQNHWK